MSKDFLQELKLKKLCKSKITGVRDFRTPVQAADKVDSFERNVSIAIEKSLTIVFCGKNAYEYMSRLFHSPETKNTVYLKDVVSRKKQFIPAVINALHTDVG